MTRLLVLVCTLLLFGAAAQATRLRRVPPRWRLRIGFLALSGTFIGAVSLLAAILLPEVLVVESARHLWHTCSVAFHALWRNPIGRWPSVVAGIVLMVVLARFAWSVGRSIHIARRARVRSLGTRASSGRYRVHVLPVDLPDAYSLAGISRQIVVTRGLLDLLDRDEQRAVLLHEEGHLRGRHHILLRLTRAMSEALWPVLPDRRALEGFEQAAEEAADEYAATKIGDALPVATSIAKTAVVGLGGRRYALAMADGPDVPGRVRRLLDQQAVPSWMAGACGAALACLVAALVLTELIGGLAVLSATHHILGFGTTNACPLFG